jgi:hypothetical protein
LFWATIESASQQGLTIENENSLDGVNIARWWDISERGRQLGDRLEIGSAHANVGRSADSLSFAHPYSSHTELIFRPDLIQGIRNGDGSGWKEFYQQRQQAMRDFFAKRRSQSE